MLVDTVLLIIQNMQVPKYNVHSAHKIHSSEKKKKKKKKKKNIKHNIPEIPPKGQTETGNNQTPLERREMHVSLLLSN